MKINSSIDPNYYTKDLKEKGVAIIKNFLAQEAIESLYHYFSKEILDDNWWACSFPT